MSVRLGQIKDRWKNERKIKGADVDWLLDMAKSAETMAAAKTLNRSSRDIVSDLFGGVG